MIDVQKFLDAMISFRSEISEKNFFRVLRHQLLRNTDESRYFRRMRKSAIFLVVGLVGIAVYYSMPVSPSTSPNVQSRKPSAAVAAREENASSNTKELPQEVADVAADSQAQLNEVTVQLDADELTQLKMKDSNSYFRVVQSMNERRTIDSPISADEKKQMAQARIGNKILEYLEKAKKPVS